MGLRAESSPESLREVVLRTTNNGKGRRGWRA
jgi:hypothetical protein